MSSRAFAVAIFLDDSEIDRIPAMTWICFSNVLADAIKHFSFGAVLCVLWLCSYKQRMHLFVHVFRTKWSIWQITYIHTRPCEFLDWKTYVHVAITKSLAPSLFPEKGKGQQKKREMNKLTTTNASRRGPNPIFWIFLHRLLKWSSVNACGLSTNIVLITRRSTARSDEMQKWSIFYFHSQSRRFNSQQTASPAHSFHTIELMLREWNKWIKRICSGWNWL